MYIDEYASCRLVISDCRQAALAARYVNELIIIIIIITRARWEEMLDKGETDERLALTW
jgi:hypothetical protein